MCVCVFFPFILDIKFVERTSRGHTGGRSHRISHPPCPGSSEVPRNPLTRWDVSSTPANGIFLIKTLKNKNKNAQRVEND